MTYEDELEQLGAEYKRRLDEITKGKHYRDAYAKEIAELDYWHYVEHFKIFKKYGKAKGEMPPYPGKRASDFE